MALDSSANVEQIQDRKGYTNSPTDGYDDLSGGVEHVIGNVPAFTIWLSTEGAVDVDVECSPDGGNTWYQLREAPLSFDAAGDDAVNIAYNCNRVRLTGSDATGIRAQIREVM